MSVLVRSARYLRHLPVLERQEWLWDFLRKPYYNVIETRHGVAVSVNGRVDIHIPAEFTSLDLSNYERENLDALIEWVRKPENRDGVFVDVGSSIGIFSAVALNASATVRVIAIDSDINSVAAVRRICSAHANRLQCVCGFVSEKGAFGLTAAVAQTDERLRNEQVEGGVSQTKYVCIDGNTDDTIPTYSLDGILADEGRRTLVKIDVEGAEKRVVDGSLRVLEKLRPDVLLSLHPDAINNYGDTEAGLKAALKACRYDMKLLAVDHEEHWFCQRTAA